MGLDGELGGSSIDGVLDGTSVQKFDTGLFRPQRSAVREGVAEMLRPLLLPALGGSARGYVRAIRALPRPLHDRSDEEMGWIGNAVQGQYPCILIALGDKDYDAGGMPATEYGGEIEIAIYVVSTNVRSFVDGRLAIDVSGASSISADPGIETMLEHVEELLIGQDPDIDGLHELRPKSEREVFTGGAESVWEQRYKMYVERIVDPDRLAGALISIETKSRLDGTDLTQPPTVDTINTLEVP